jgi:parallel beta-helix repeat protein/predicted outer membrane repeat protein
MKMQSTMCVVLVGAMFIAIHGALGAVIYVDDDWGLDPGPGNPLVSDPNEDGSAGHPFDAIQEAIDAAVGGDVVEVADGTYTGLGNKNLDYGGKAITVRSASGNPNTCVIDCEGNGRGFYFHNGEDSNSIVEGLTITNGDESFGGGIRCLGSSPSVIHCLIINNTSAVSGGGLYCSTSSPVLIYCLVGDNRAVSLGGGIYCNSDSSPILINSVIGGNSSSSLGGGLYCNNSSPSLYNCHITSNHANSGGGIRCYTLSDAILTNCTISGNTASNNGGGVYCTTSSPTLTNSVIWGNIPEAIYTSSGTPNVNYCNVEGNWAGTGNIDSDPYFIDPDGPDNVPDTWIDNDYRLTFGSPCIDAGDNTAVPTDIADLDGDGNVVELLPYDHDGQPRFVDDYMADNGNGVSPICDMGAYERQYESGTHFYVLPGELKGVLDISAPIACFLDPPVYLHLSAGNYYPDELSSDNQEESFTISIPCDVYILGSTSADPNVQLTVLTGDIGGGTNSHHVVTISDSPWPSGSVFIDSISIQDGHANGDPWLDYNKGAGVLINTVQGDVTFRNCVFRNNQAGYAVGGYCEPGVSGSGYGAALYLESGSRCSIQHSQFIDNATYGCYGHEPDSAAYGGGIYGNQCQLTINDCSFLNNQAVSESGTGGGGAIYLLDVTTGHISDSVFRNNFSWFGDGAAIGGGTLGITNCLFEDNLADFHGAAIAGDYTYIRDCDIRQNSIYTCDPWDPNLCMYSGEVNIHMVNEIQNMRIATLDALAGGGYIGSIATIIDQLELASGVFEIGELVDGPGRVIVDLEATLMPAESRFISSVVRCDIVGNGLIYIPRAKQLTLENGATIDLSGEQSTGGCADPNDSDQWGTITVEGSLVVCDATVQNTNVDVKLADFQGQNIIVNNDIHLLEASTGFGGEFFVEGASTIQCNHIVSEGDRYLDLDPDPSIDPNQRPWITENVIDVIISQGTHAQRGELLELRGGDYDCGNPNGVNPDCRSGAYHAMSSPGFTADPSANWVLDSLEILPDAKVSLTNRQGFDFGIEPNHPETVYVKKLKLHPGAILNTALQTLYYQSLVDENELPLMRDPNNLSGQLSNGSRIVDVPLLGFSLKIIAMEDDTELEVRVRERVQDPEELQDCRCVGSCGDGHQHDPNWCMEGSIQRVPFPLSFDPNNHALQMRTRGDNRLQASSVAAKGAFARAGEDEVIVAFDYHFVEAPDPNTILIVYLSDDPDVSVQLQEIARLYPPQSGIAGAVGSNRFASFLGHFPRGTMNFRRGTYVELELRGDDAVIDIDNWDPQISCPTPGACGDFGAPAGVAEEDFLFLLGEYGQTLSVEGANDPKWCLDQITQDGIVGLDDLLLWDTILGNPEQLNLCNSSQTLAASVCAQQDTVSIVSTNIPHNRLVIAGKPSALDSYGFSHQADFLYTLRATDRVPDAKLTPASQPGGLFMQYRGNGRLVTDALGQLHQLHGAQGLIRLSDGVSVLPPTIIPLSYNGSQVRVGMSSSLNEGMPLLDAAFDRNDPNLVYVVPVLVQPLDGQTYRAAAQLRLSGNSFDVETMYGIDPSQDPHLNGQPPETSVIDVQRLKEIEVDQFGNVFVTSGQHLNDNSWLLVYDSNENELRFKLSDPNLGGIQGPTAMMLSADAATLYIASRTTTYGATDTQVHRFLIQRNANDVVTGLSHVPATDTLTIDAMRDISAILEHPCSGTLWILGTAWDEPDQGWDWWAEFATFSYNEPIFTSAVMAIAEPGVLHVTATALDLFDLGLPIAAAFHEAAGAIQDLNCDGLVDMSDIELFLQALTGPDINLPPSGISPAEFRNADLDADQDVDMHDMSLMML